MATVSIITSVAEALNNMSFTSIEELVSSLGANINWIFGTSVGYFDIYYPKDYVRINVYHPSGMPMNNNKLSHIVINDVGFVLSNPPADIQALKNNIPLTSSIVATTLSRSTTKDTLSIKFADRSAITFTYKKFPVGGREEFHKAILGSWRQG